MSRRRALPPAKAPPLVDKVLVSREGQIHLDDTLSGAFRRSEEALMAIGAGIRKRDQAAGRLEAIFPINWRSWGEKVGVDVLGVDGDALVQIKSRSSLPTTLIDWGKNADNMRRFLGALTKVRYSAPAEA